MDLNDKKYVVESQRYRQSIDFIVFNDSVCYLLFLLWRQP